MLGILNDALDTWDQWFKSVDFDTRKYSTHGFEVRVPSVWMRGYSGARHPFRNVDVRDTPGSVAADDAWGWFESPQNAFYYRRQSHADAIP
jgi:hypothetical protein